MQVDDTNRRVPTLDDGSVYTPIDFALGFDLVLR